MTLTPRQTKMIARAVWLARISRMMFWLVLFMAMLAMLAVFEIMHVD